MEGNKPSRCGNSSRHFSDDRTGSIDQVRANEGMNQAMVLGNLTLSAFAHVRAWLKSVGQAVGRGPVPKRRF
jgi:hypothetical protein